MQAGDEQPGGGLFTFGLVPEAFLTSLSVFIQQLRELQFRGVGRQTGDADLDNIPLWEPSLDFANVLFDSPDNNLITMFRGDRNTTAESLRVEDLQQG